MNITVVGAGYVGLTLAAVLADFGHRVWLVRKDKKKNEWLKKGKVHFFEPGLEDLVKKNIKTNRLYPTTDYSQAIPDSEVVFICVGTPSGAKGQVDLSQVFEAAAEIGKNLKKGYTVVVDKSTVPPGTAEKVKAIINKNRPAGAEFAVCSSPEFLREGFAVKDTFQPDRVVIGSDDIRATRVLKNLHRDFKAPILITKTASAELIKYGANSYLALRIVFANQLADLCEKTGANINQVIKGVGSDKRIGEHYWYPGLGYGGSCFPKDVAALAAFSSQKGMKTSLFEEIDKLNKNRIPQILKVIQKKYGFFKGKTIGVLGLACKQGTDDIRQSPAIKVIQLLQKNGAKIQAYDPLAIPNAQLVLKKIKFCSDSYQAAQKADALWLLADWPEFAQLDYVKIKKLMRGVFVFDSRNLLEPEKMEKLGFKYQGIGR